MANYRVVQIREARDGASGGWVIEFSNPDGSAVIQGRLYTTREAAESEAARLNATANS
jgi:hypothetical protein